MSSICGIFSRKEQPMPPESITAMIKTLNHWNGDRTGIWQNIKGTVALGNILLCNTPESLAENLPFHHPSSGLTITADARIDNRNDLCHLLDIPVQKQTIIPDSQLILESYQKWGRDCTAHLIGDFVFAIWDEKEKRLFCARDHLGAKPFYYFAGDDSFIFATEIKGIFKVNHLSRTLDEQWIADVLTALIADKEYTTYQHIRRLPPANWISISPGDIKKESYWSLDPEKESYLHSEEDYVETFREKLTEAVRCRVRSAFSVGSELSGGLDSSAVTALAVRQAEARNLKFMAFSHVLSEADRLKAESKKDEKEFQDMLCRYARINHAFSISAQDHGVVKTLQNSLLLQDGPNHRSYGYFTDVLHETAAREGARTLLSGFGGDEVVSYHAREYMNELAHRRAWQNLWEEFRQYPAPEEKTPIKSILFRIAGEYLPRLKTASLLIRDRIMETKQALPARHLELFPIAPEFYQAAAIRHRLVSIPRQRSRTEDVRSSQCLHIMHTPVPIRLEICSIEAASHRLEYRYPLLDIRLLEFHLAAPSNLKRKNGYGRYLFRRAVEGAVPPEIQWRTDKTGATIPGIRHRIIRDARIIENLIQKSRHTRAAYYINLEQMLKRLERIVNTKADTAPIRQGVFLNALKLLLYFDDNQ